MNQARAELVLLAGVELNKGDPLSRANTPTFPKTSSHYKIFPFSPAHYQKCQDKFIPDSGRHVQKQKAPSDLNHWGLFELSVELERSSFPNFPGVLPCFDPIWLGGWNFTPHHTNTISAG